jgi:hypothetical protein
MRAINTIHVQPDLEAAVTVTVPKDAVLLDVLDDITSTGILALYYVEDEEPATEERQLVFAQIAAKGTAMASQALDTNLDASYVGIAGQFAVFSL